MKGNIYYIILAYSIFIPLIVFPLYKEKAGTNINGSLSKNSAKGSLFSKIGAITFGILGLAYFGTASSVVCQAEYVEIICTLVYTGAYTFISMSIGFIVGALIGISVDFTKR